MAGAREALVVGVVSRVSYKDCAEEPGRASGICSGARQRGIRRRAGRGMQIRTRPGLRGTLGTKKKAQQKLLDPLGSIPQAFRGVKAADTIEQEGRCLAPVCGAREWR